MEVHHPHHHSGHVKKKFQEYFSEFLMLFAAVTLGFFAENKREHYVEREREHQYMQSFYEDLRKDTAELGKVRKTFLRQAAYIDTTVEYIFNGKNDTASIKKLYKLNLGTLGTHGVKFIERTSSQLKNAGGLRLIENNEISDKIAIYWHYAAYIQSYGVSTEELKLKAREMSYYIFNSDYYQNQELGNSKDKVKPGAKLMTNDKTTLFSYANRLNHIRNSLRNVSVQQIDSTKLFAIQLMGDLKKEYHLK